MLDIALAALSLSLTQEVDADPWVEVDGEWQRTLTCTVDTNRAFRMRGRYSDPAFRLNEGEQFRLTLHDHDDGFRAISIAPPEGIEGDAVRHDRCAMGPDGRMFRCNISLRQGQVMDFYGGLEEHRFSMTLLDDPIGMASDYGSDPSRMDIAVTSGVCLD